MEQKRFKDEHGYKYDFSAVIRRGEQVAVHCPRCQGLYLCRVARKAYIRYDAYGFPFHSQVH